MNPNLPVALYAAAYFLLFGGWLALVLSKTPGADTLVEFIQATLGALTGHVLTMINPKGASDAPPAKDASPPVNGQAGFARPLFLMMLAAIAALSLGGCTALNAYTSAALTAAQANGAAAVKNIQTADDMKLKAWLVDSCAQTVGALQRAASTSGSANAIRAIFTACPVQGVGVTSVLPTGSLDVQTTNVSPAAPAPATAPAK